MLQIYISVILQKKSVVVFLHSSVRIGAENRTLMLTAKWLID